MGAKTVVRASGWLSSSSAPMRRRAAAKDDRSGRAEMAPNRVGVVLAALAAALAAVAAFFFGCLDATTPAALAALFAGAFVAALRGAVAATAAVFFRGLVVVGGAGVGLARCRGGRRRRRHAGEEGGERDEDPTPPPQLSFSPPKLGRARRTVGRGGQRGRDHREGDERRREGASAHSSGALCGARLCWGRARGAEGGEEATDRGALCVGKNFWPAVARERQFNKIYGWVAAAVEQLRLVLGGRGGGARARDHHWRLPTAHRLRAAPRHDAREPARPPRPKIEAWHDLHVFGTPTSGTAGRRRREARGEGGGEEEESLRRGGERRAKGRTGN